MIQKVTYPGPWDDWAWKKPHQVGMNASRLDEAIGYAKAHETSWSNNMADHFNMNSEIPNPAKPEPKRHFTTKAPRLKER